VAEVAIVTLSVALVVIRRPLSMSRWIVGGAVIIVPIIAVVTAVVAIIGAVAGIVIGVLGASARFIIAAIIVAILFGVAALVPTLIEKFTGQGVIDDLPPVNDMIASPTAAIKWPAAGVFNVTAAGLNGALVLGGDPNFS